jgi:D-alanyl-D-alanine carboxypeptidase
LQMTSGIYNYTETDAFYEAVEDDPSYAWTAEEVLTYIYDEDAYFEAGTDYYYSNSNYILAQIAIETVTGNSLAEELENRIFEPLGMDACYLETPELVGENVVRGYQWDDADWYEDITEINDGLGLGDGGIVCSASDLALFLPALMNGDLLDDAMLDEMLDSVDDGEGGTYGLGIVHEEGDFGTEIWHDGSSSGFQSIILYLPDEDLSLVILSNDNDAEIIADLAYDAIELVFEQ